MGERETMDHLGSDVRVVVEVSQCLQTQSRDSSIVILMLRPWRKCQTSSCVTREHLRKENELVIK